MKYKVTFEHTQKFSYDAFIEAENEKEAKKICKEDPYLFVDDMEGELIEGIELKIISVERV